MTVPIRIYDSMRREKVPLEPLVPGKISMYLCGPTTYDSAHLGHAYSAICFDVIRKSLQWLGFDVRFVRNITDVDDKIIARANEIGEKPTDLAARFADEYNADMARFGVEPPTVEPRVSTHIGEIIALIETLISKKKAYSVDGDVYFSVESFPNYGKLSGQSVDDLRSGARIEVDARKQSPVDFALWKSAKPGEPSWESPWGPGRPGWHIECSAMTTAHLGETFDLHGGGKDLIFPHHENEIAQSQGAHGDETFAKIWLHNGFVNFGGEKMSKSIGNCFGCEPLSAAAGPEAVRFFTISHHYRSPVQFEVDSDENGQTIFRDLEAADRRLDYFYTTLKRIDDFLAAGTATGDGEILPAAKDFVSTARNALADDFNAPVLLAAMGDAAKLANKLLDSPKSAPKSVRRQTLAKLGSDIRNVASAVGILSSDPKVFLRERRDRLTAKRNIDGATVDKLLEERAKARGEKNFERADEIREQLTNMNVEVLDSPTGVTWKVVDNES